MPEQAVIETPPPGEQYQDESPLPDLRGYDPTIRAGQEEAMAGMKEAGGRIEALQGEKAGAMQLPRQEIISQIDAFKPSAPILEQTDDPPDVRQHDAEAFRNYFMPAMIFGALLGKAMGADNVDALNMLSAGMRGFQEGRTQYGAHMIAQWREKTQAIIQRNQSRLNMYRAVMEDRNTSINDKMLRMQLVAAQYDDKIMQAQLAQQNWQKVSQAYDKMAMQQNQMMRLYETQGYHADTIEVRKMAIEEHARASNNAISMAQEKMRYAQDKDVIKRGQKVTDAYNEGVGKIWASAETQLQIILRSKVFAYKPEARNNAINMLAIAAARDMHRINSLLRVNNMPVPYVNEVLEDSREAKNALLTSSTPTKEVPYDRLGERIQPPPTPTPQRPPAEPSRAFEVAPGGAAPQNLPEGTVLPDKD